MTAVRAFAGLLALSALPACGGAVVPAAAPPPQVTAEVKQYRADIAPRRLSAPDGTLTSVRRLARCDAEPDGPDRVRLDVRDAAVAVAVALELPMVITATRCDGHALAESKRSYIVAFFTAVGGGEPHLTTVTAEPPLQRQLDRLALDTCRPGS